MRAAKLVVEREGGVLGEERRNKVWCFVISHRPHSIGRALDGVTGGKRVLQGRGGGAVENKRRLMGVATPMRFSHADLQNSWLKENWVPCVICLFFVCFPHFIVYCTLVPGICFDVFVSLW